jgi:hypothetical protein
MCKVIYVKRKSKYIIHVYASFSPPPPPPPPPKKNNLKLIYEVLGSYSEWQLLFLTSNVHTAAMFLLLKPCLEMSGKFPVLHNLAKSRDSSVGIALGYGLDDQGSRVRFQAGAGNFSLHRVQNGSGTHPASYPMGTRGSGDKAAGAWSWPLTSI